MTQDLPATMRAAFLARPGELVLRDVPVPRPRDGELLVRVEVALTCGTDLKLFQRGHARIPTPTPFGHEFSGRVAAAGAGTPCNVGEPIVSVPTAPCGECPLCLSARENLCPLAVGRMVLGAFAEFVLLPAHIVARHVFARPVSLHADNAALLEPLACVVHGASRIDWNDTRDVVILGDGPIGLLFARIAILRGARVVVIGRHTHRLEVARGFGAVTALDGGDIATADLVVECVGTPEAWREASELARAGGRVLMFGGCAPGTQVSFDAARIHYEEVDIIGAFHYTPAAVLEALALLTSRQVDATSLITHRVPLEHLHEALALVADRTAIKVAVEP